MPLKPHPTDPDKMVYVSHKYDFEQGRQRPWVGLTDDEIEQACVPLGAAMLSFTEVAQAIEAKLKEKNNGT